MTTNCVFLGLSDKSVICAPPKHVGHVILIHWSINWMYLLIKWFKSYPTFSWMCLFESLWCKVALSMSSYYRNKKGKWYFVKPYYLLSRIRTPELREEDELLVFKEGYCLWKLKELRCSFRVAKIKDWYGAFLPISVAWTSYLVIEFIAWVYS